MEQFKMEKIINTALKKTWNSWNCMRRRCTYIKDKRYKYYGGRGITVCYEWFNSFGKFVKDMGERPDGKTLERIDNKKGYYKENCKWATIKEQNLNRNIPVNKTSIYRGVSQYKKDKKWYAYASIGKTVHIGSFSSEIEAARAYNRFIIKNNLPNKLNEIMG